MPILESGGCDLTFTGHSHIYERSMLVDGAYATPTIAKGVILDDGDGDPNGDGAYVRPPDSTRTTARSRSSPATGHRSRPQGNHADHAADLRRKRSALIHISGDTLHGTMINSQGTVRDTFAIVKSDVTPLESDRSRTHGSRQGRLDKSKGGTTPDPNSPNGSQAASMSTPPGPTSPAPIRPATGPAGLRDIGLEARGGGIRLRRRGRRTGLKGRE